MTEKSRIPSHEEGIWSYDLTPLQLKVLHFVVRGTGEDSIAQPNARYLDIDQLMVTMDYTRHKAAMQSLLAKLELKGFLQKAETVIRRGKRRRILVPTELAIKVIASQLPKSSRRSRTAAAASAAAADGTPVAEFIEDPIETAFNSF